MNSLRKLLHYHRKNIIVATATSAASIGLVTSADASDSYYYHYYLKFDRSLVGFVTSACDDSTTIPHRLQQQEQQQQQQQQQKEQQQHDAQEPASSYTTNNSPSLWKRLLVSVGISSLPLPRILTTDDPAFKIPARFLRKRHDDEERMRKVLTEEAPKLRGDPHLETKMASLRKEIFELAYGKGVTAQMREDFLVRYGCTGFNNEILHRLITLCGTRGIVEVGAGHGQWQKALVDAFNRDDAERRSRTDTISGKKPLIQHDNKGNGRNFDFCLAYDNNSNLPLNTHIYNQYTQPHHDHFGTVQKVESKLHLDKILRSWACRGRALLMVYPPPGSMAANTLETYTGASSDNDTLIYVGEGRGGANADNAFFDSLENGEWILVDVLEVLRPPGDKGCEKLYILCKIRTDP